MEKLLKEGSLQNDSDNLFPGVGGTLFRVERDLTEFDFTKVGSVVVTKKIEEVINRNLAVWKRLDNSPNFRNQVKAIADRNEAWAK